MNSFVLIIFSILISFSCAMRPVGKTPHTSKYLRSDWQHWSDSDRDCLDIRGEILKLRSLSPVAMNKNGCRVKTGKWKDYYYPEIHTQASKVDIDHLVPLKHAHDFGAANWNKSQKEKFANDPENLVITNRSYNRQKGAKGINEWLPRHRDYTCKYISDWVKIKKKYSLGLGEGEKNSIESLKKDCRL